MRRSSVSPLEKTISCTGKAKLFSALTMKEMQDRKSNMNKDFKNDT